MITLTNHAPLFAFAKKIFGSLGNLVLALPGSLSMAELLEALVAETPIKELVLPLVVSAVSLSFYFIVFSLDFLSGVKASRKELGPDYFSSAKGWSSIWKIATVSLLVTWSGFFSMLAALGNMTLLASFFMLSGGTIAIMASLLDIYSIGENQQRLTGKKARIFVWLEKLMKIIDEGALERVRKLFSG